MKLSTKLLAAGASLCVLYTPTSFAQDGSSFSLEEIIVTGRKREESLQEVPISISVINDQFIRDAGIVDQQDLFELTPGIFYDEQIDRLSQSTNVRGVQSAEIATNRTKVSSFIDGMPVIGAPASIAIGSTRQVEIYRGPQSAAFGRSTFGGAINYISPDPTEELEGEVAVDINDYGRRIFNGQISGPITENIGFLLSAQIEDSDAPSEFTSNEGVQYGARSGESFGGKLVFRPTENLEIEFGYSTADTEDGPQVQYFLTEEARNACFDGTVSNDMGVNVWSDGVFDCDWTQGADIVTQADRVPNLQAFYDANPDELIPFTDAGYTLDDLLFLADAWSLPLNRFGAFDERDRATLQIDYDFANGSLLQFSAFTGEEEYIREYETSRYPDGVIDISLTTTGMGPGAVTGPPLSVNTAMGAAIGAHMADPTEIEEDYAEVRWVSPSDQRLRWVVGASYYSSYFFTRIYTGGYTAVLDGTVERADELLGYDTDPDTSVGFANPILGEESENTGAFVNLTYDLTDDLTITAEARYQVDDVSATDQVTGFSLREETTALLPRISFNYNLSDDTSIYGQIAKGNNPAGINATMLGLPYQETLDLGVPDGRGEVDGVIADPVTCDGSDAAGDNPDCNSFYVDYTSDDISTFEEEELTQLEFGIKGSAFDNRMTYSAAIYKIFWENEALTTNLNWDWPDAPMGGGEEFTGSRGAINNGDKESQGLEFEGNFRATENFSLRGTFSYLDSEYVDYCDITNTGNAGLLAASGAEAGTHPIYGDCVIISGNFVSQQPQFSGSLSPSFTTDVGNGLSLNVRGDVRYQGKQYLDFFEIAELPATTTVNVSGSLRADNWSAALYVNNLFDDDTPRRIAGGTDYSLDPADAPVELTDAGIDAQQNILITPQTPRTVGLRINYNF